MTFSDVSGETFAIEDEEIQESMIEVLDALLDAMPVLAEPAGAPHSSTTQGRIDIRAGSSTVLTVRANSAIAHKLAIGWSLVGDEGVPTDEDANDAMGEFTNLVGGSMKFLFVEESALGLPVVEVIEGGPADGRHWVDIHHQVGRFQVELHPAAD